MLSKFRLVLILAFGPCSALIPDSAAAQTFNIAAFSSAERNSIFAEAQVNATPKPDDQAQSGGYAHDKFSRRSCILPIEK